MKLHLGMRVSIEQDFASPVFGVITAFGPGMTVTDQDGKTYQVCEADLLPKECFDCGDTDIEIIDEGDDELYVLCCTCGDVNYHSAQVKRETCGLD